MIRPNSYKEIVETFGDITKYINPQTGHVSPAWEANTMALAKLPDVLPIAWDMAKSVGKIYCHNLMVPVFEDVFQMIHDAGLWSKVESFAGCYNFRPMKISGKLSTHAWGIAVDINSVGNEQGTDGNIDPALVEVFKGRGFIWGGDWEQKYKDPMHFQYADGY